MRGQQRMQGLIPPPYESFAGSVFDSMTKIGAVTHPAGVAVWQAANDTSGRLPFAAGLDAAALAQKRIDTEYRRTRSACDGVFRLLTWRRTFALLRPLLAGSR